MKDNPTVVFPEPGKVVLENKPCPSPKAGELLVQTHRTLISTGTELTMLSGKFPPDSCWESYVHYPVMPGYCNAGTVVGLGAEVDRKWLGQRVASYGNHARYVTVRANQNPSESQTNLDGQLAISIPSPWVLARPMLRDVPDEHAIFFTIGEIVMNGVRRANVRWGEAVVVYGLGLLGQLTVQICRMAGARPIIGVDVSESRLRCLPEDPAVIRVNAAASDVSAAVEKVTRGRKADVVFEVTGNPEAISQEVRVLRNQGRLVILSSPKGKTQFDFHDLCNAPSHTIIGAHNFSHPAAATLDNPWTNLRDAELFFDLVADGAVQLERLISHRARYDKACDLYQMLVNDRSNAMGVILDWRI